MENKCQEAVKELKDFVHSELDGTRMLDRYLKHCDTLQELVDQNKEYTLEECKKMWEDLGYEWRIPKKYPHMIWLVDDDEEEKWILTIKINTQSKKYWKIRGDSSFEAFTFEEHDLITKTIKALEKEEK